MQVELMYRINLAKFLQHPDLQKDLLSTGECDMVGAGSTSWKTKSGAMVNWSLWNGRIQMRVREELRPAAERRQEVLEAMVKEFEDYLQGEGGAKEPIPEASPPDETGPEAPGGS
ncbi:unnamed protein product [Symbiodinium natans]|uniref:Uncharacterized protein n=1 Tax=Symbiodinium natans TaxID=878477 RepID=A0A812PII3_9DINO|nr:unnamed protein product [Symbiodinium natans]